MTVLSLADARASLSKHIESAATTHERFEITRNGARVAVLLSADDYDSLIETVDILSSPEEVAGLRVAIAELDSEDGRARSPGRVSDAYEVVFTRSARRALEITLPESVAAAAFEFIVGPLASNPRRVGKPLREPLAPLYSARRGEYRVLYRIEDQRLVIEVVTIEHRRDAYHRR